MGGGGGGKIWKVLEILKTLFSEFSYWECEIHF